MLRRMFSIVFPIIAVGLVMYVTTRVGAQNRQGPTILRNLPQQWVPFSADVIQSADDDPGSIGKFYRNSDGSERFDIPSGVNTYAYIKNLLQRIFYRRQGGPGQPWVAHPMILPPEGWTPIPFLTASPRITRLNEPYEGMEAYQRTYKGGRIDVAIPDLNFFAVRKQLANNRRLIRYFNINRGEPDHSLFEPPAGAVVEKSDQPDGIVFSPEPSPVRP